MEDLAELLKKQGRIEEALRVMQEAQDLLQVHETVESIAGTARRRAVRRRAGRSL